MSKIKLTESELKNIIKEEINEEMKESLSMVNSVVNNLVKNWSVVAATEAVNWDFPDYAGLPHKLSYKLSSDLVDYIQQFLGEYESSYDFSVPPNPKVFKGYLRDWLRGNGNYINSYIANK
jgi:hypothetical protein